jgi:hypothetical protein
MTDYERGYLQGKDDAKKDWSGLTKDEINRCVVHTGIHVFEGDIYQFVHMLEDILQEKNA